MLKVKHTYEVVNKSEYIAEGLGIDEENTELAKLIGLLHDIGRFEQVKQTNDFLDAKVLTMQILVWKCCLIKI